MHKSELNNGSMEVLLERYLSRTTAPESLWERIETPRVDRTAVARRRLAWALTAAMLILAIVWGLKLHGQTAAALEFRPVETARVRASAPMRTCALCHASFNGQTAFD